MHPVARRLDEYVDCPHYRPDLLLCRVIIIGAITRLFFPSTSWSQLCFSWVSFLLVFGKAMTSSLMIAAGITDDGFDVQS
jgi:hypothetical protein